MNKEGRKMPILQVMQETERGNERTKKKEKKGKMQRKKKNYPFVSDTGERKKKERHVLM